MKHFAGLDVSVKETSICIVDETGKICRSGTSYGSGLRRGIGPVTASVLAASIQDISAFSRPRELAVFLGFTPRQSSSGGKERLGRVSKMSTDILRKLLGVGAHAALFHRGRCSDASRGWADRLMETSPSSLLW